MWRDERKKQYEMEKNARLNWETSQSNTKIVNGKLCAYTTINSQVVYIELDTRFPMFSEIYVQKGRCICATPIIGNCPFHEAFILKNGEKVEWHQ